MSAIQVPQRTGRLWQQRIEGIQEYEVIRDGNVFNTSFTSSFVYTSEYEEAHRTLRALVDQYDGRSFDSVFPGRVEENAGGTCFVTESRHPVLSRLADAGRFREEVLSDLTLVHGIGPAVQNRLKMRGYGTLGDLCRHPRYRAGAARVISCINDGNSSEIMNLIGSRHSRSHRSVLGTVGLHEPEDFVFFDIETLGLFSRPIILFGIGTFENGRLRVYQYLLRDIEEEEAALLATAEHLSGDHPALVTFNGKSFDLPYVTDRLAYYGLGTPAEIPHYDMLHFSRRRWKGELSSLRLTALERDILGISRDGDIPGQMVPEFYATYQRTGNVGPLVPILEHNCQDVVSLAKLFFHLVGETCGCS